MRGWDVVEAEATGEVEILPRVRALKVGPLGRVSR
jgi:hypothetical protein